MSVKDLYPIGDVLSMVTDHCESMYAHDPDEHTAAALEWIREILMITNFGGRANNAKLRDEVLIVAGKSLEV